MENARDDHCGSASKALEQLKVLTARLEERVRNDTQNQRGEAMIRLIVRKLIVYSVMIAFILGCIAVVGGMGRMLTLFNFIYIVITGLGLAYVLDKQLAQWFTPTQV